MIHGIVAESQFRKIFFCCRIKGAQLRVFAWQITDHLIELLPLYQRRAVNFHSPRILIPISRENWGMGMKISQVVDIPHIPHFRVLHISVSVEAAFKKLTL